MWGFIPLNYGEDSFPLIMGGIHSPYGGFLSAFFFRFNELFSCSCVMFVCLFVCFCILLLSGGNVHVAIVSFSESFEPFSSLVYCCPLHKNRYRPYLAAIVDCTRVGSVTASFKDCVTVAHDFSTNLTW